MSDDTVTIAVPRSALTVVERPRLASQRNAQHVLGLAKREFLAAAREFAREGGEVMTLGRLRLVDVEAFTRWLSARARAARATAPEARADDDAELLAALGLERAK